MHSIQTFNNPLFGDLRTIIINEKEYFFGIDIATDLMYKRPRKAVIDHCKGVLNQDGSVLTQDGEPIIPEGDVYRLIIKAGQQGNSKEIKEKADELEKWIFDDILPTLRKTGTYGRAKSTQEQITLIAQGTTELYQRVEGVESEVGTVKAEIEALRDELPLFPSEADKIKNAVNKRVVEILGGKESNAYKDNSLCRKVFINCYQNLKGNFEGIGKYTEIKRKYRHEALRIVERYEPPFFLAQQIESANAQQSLDLEGGAHHG